MLKYTTIKELEKLSVSEFGDLLKHYWKTDEFTFVATFVSEKKTKTKGLEVLKILGRGKRRNLT